MMLAISQERAQVNGLSCMDRNVTSYWIQAYPS